MFEPVPKGVLITRANFIIFLREKEKAKWLSTVEITDEGISTDQEGNPIPISFSNFVLSLQGPFQPLSNYYAFTFEIKGCFYRKLNIVLNDKKKCI